MEVSEVLKSAWKAVGDAGLPEEMHEVAFREAVRLMAPQPVASTLTAQGTTGATAVGGGGSAKNGSQADAGPSVSEEEMYAKVATGTGVDRDQLEQLVHMDDDGPRVSVAGLKLGKNNAERARAVAQLLTVTRSFGLSENDTSLEVIRKECERLKVYDSANFSSQVKALSGYIINGSGQNRRMRVKSPGVQAFPDLVKNLLGAS